MRFCSITRKPVSCMGGETAWIRIIAETQPILVISAIQPRLLRSCMKYKHENIKEYVLPLSQAIELRQLVLDIIKQECDVIFLNDICGINGEILEIILKSKIYCLLIVHEGNPYQCSQWIHAAKHVDKIVIFDKLYKKHVIPQDYRRKTVDLGHPVPYINTMPNRKDLIISLLVRSCDWKLFRNDIIMMESIARFNNISIAIIGTTKECISIVKELKLSNIICIPTIPPSFLSKIIGKTQVVLPLRIPSASGKILFPTQVLESFNPYTPIIAPRYNDFFMTTSIMKKVIAGYLNTSIITFTEFSQIVQAIKEKYLNKYLLDEWKLNYQNFYKHYNSRKWIKRIMEILS